MKRDPERQLAISARRTLHNLQEVLVDLLETEPLEKITVSELCEQTMIPRATFYNYFEDKYDLLQYHWSCVVKELDPLLEGDAQPELAELDYGDYLFHVASNLIDYISAHIMQFRDIEHANERSSFFQVLQDYSKKQISENLDRFELEAGDYRVPDDLEASFCASVAITLGRWWLENEGRYTRDQAMEYFSCLLVKSRVFGSAIERDWVSGD